MSIDDVLRSRMEQLTADAGVPPELLEGPQSAEAFRGSRRADEEAYGILREQHEAFTADLAKVLDIEAGLREVLGDDGATR